MSKPKIRFKGYCNDWERRKFGDIVEKYENPVETPTEGYMRLGIRSHAKGTFHNYVEKGKELETAKMFRVAADKFIVNITFGWEHAVAITDENDAGKLVSHRFPQYSFNEGMVPKFFRYLILDENFKHHLELSSPGGAGRNRVLKLNEMLEYKMNFPSEEEQKKIASYFDNLDHLITLHQRQCENAKKLKKFMLQKMFPKKNQKNPEIRFVGFTNDWERRKLGEVAEFNPKSEIPDEFEYVDLESVVGTEMISHRTEAKESAPSRAQRVAQTGDVFFQTVRPYQRNNYLFLKQDKNYVFSTGYAQMRPYIDAAFLMSFLQTDSFVKIVLDNCTGTSYPAINSHDLSNLEISLSKSLEEQKKVGEIITTLDHFITLHQNKCDELKKLKKFMLQNMFI